MVKTKEIDFGVQQLRPEKPKRSDAAENVGRWGWSGYRIGRAVASVCLIVASLHSLLSSEQVAYRLLSLFFIGCVPALLVYLLGCVALRTLTLASTVYDPVSVALISGCKTLGLGAAMIRDVYLYPGMEILGGWVAPLAAILLAGGLILARRSRTMIARAMAVARRRTTPAQLTIARRAMIRVATAPVRLLANLLLKIQSPAAPHGRL